MALPRCTEVWSAAVDQCCHSAVSLQLAAVIHNNQVFVVSSCSSHWACLHCVGRALPRIFFHYSHLSALSSNWNDKLRSYSWDSPTLPVSTNPCQRGEIWWHSYRGERTLAAIITTKNSSELLTQLFKISKRNPKQTNYRNLRRNYWSCPSGIIRKHKHHRPRPGHFFKCDFIQFCVDNTEVFQP